MLGRSHSRKETSWCS